jgi:hypothetical protein
LGKNTYNGGGTIVHAGSGFFSHKGGPGRKRPPLEGSDTPGPAKPGSICDFSSIRPKRRKVVEFATKTKRSTISKEEADAKKLLHKATGLIARSALLKKQREAEVARLQADLKKARMALEQLTEIADFAGKIDLKSPNLKQDTKKLEGRLSSLPGTKSRHLAKTPPKNSPKIQTKREKI